MNVESQWALWFKPIQEIGDLEPKQRINLGSIGIATMADMSLKTTFTLLDILIGQLITSKELNIDHDMGKGKKFRTWT